jgi:lipoprotein-anchoring transpeptidase ErfK/SrfK
VNSLKTLLGATLLAALAYGVYVGITKKPGQSDESALVDAPRIEPGKSANAPKAFDSPTEVASVEAPAFTPESAESTAAPPFAETAKNAWEQESAGTTVEAPLSDDPPLPVVADAPLTEHEHAAPLVENTNIDPATTQASATSAVTPPTAQGYFQTKMAEVENQLREGQLAEAHLALSQFYGAPELSPEEHQRVVELLSQLAGTVVYSREHLLAPAHTVVAGETLEQIATAHNVPWQLLAKINGVTGPGPLQPGQQLKVVNGPFHAYVDLEDRQLVLFLDGKYYAGRFPVAFGKENEPAPERYTVKNKAENPTYYGAGGATFGPGDPQNPLGTRKIELDRQLSIHGTNDPTSLDRDDPRGCIRLSPSDAEDVFDILTVGSEVVIQR